MNRQEIREHVRFLFNEYKERPEGFIKDETTGEVDINLLINISQIRVQIELLPFIPHFFYKPVLLNITVNKNVYDVVTDWSITDFILFKDIFHNLSGKRPDGLLYANLDQIRDFTTVGLVQEPKVWTYESKTSIGFYPICPATLNERYKAYYYYELPDLNHDSSDSKTKVTGATIAFVLATGKITDSNNGLAGFLTGDKIKVTGSVSNNGTYIVATGGVAGEIVVIESLVDEDAGASVTIEAINVTTSLLPKATHPLIAIDVVEQLQIADESGALEIRKLKEIEMNKALKLLDIKPSLRTEKRASLAESVR